VPGGQRRQQDDRSQHVHQEHEGEHDADVSLELQRREAANGHLPFGVPPAPFRPLKTRGADLDPFASRTTERQRGSNSSCFTADWRLIATQ